MLNKDVYKEVTIFKLNFKTRFLNNDPELRSDLEVIKNKIDGEVYSVELGLDRILDLIGKLLDNYNLNELEQSEQYNILLEYIKTFQDVDYITILQYRVKFYYVNYSEELEEILSQLENLEVGILPDIEFKYDLFNVLTETVLRVGTDDQVNRVVYIINSL